MEEKVKEEVVLKEGEVKEVSKKVTIREEQEKDLIVWTAPARPFKRRTRDFYVTLLAMAGLFGLILFFVDGPMPVILIIALLFLFYVMSTIEPEKVEYKITNKGVKIAKERIAWGFLGRFWFTNRLGSEVLVLETDSITGRTEIVIDQSLKEKIIKALSEYLVYEEVPASFIDKTSNWFSTKFAPK